MRTDELVLLLAADARPASRRTASSRIAWALLAGLPLAAAIVQLAFGVRGDLAAVATQPMFWLKVLAPAAVAIAGVVTLGRLGRPGVDAGAGWLAMAVPLLLLWAIAAAAYLQAPADARAALVWGRTWRSCAFNIATVSVPMLVAAFVALRRLAPTDPARAGACAGLLAGAAAAAVYAFHCPEMAAPFVAIWYVAGIALPTAVGAVLGPRLLRW